MNIKKYAVKVVFENPVLGSQSTKQVATEFIAKRNGIEMPDDEVETLPDALERSTTVFHKDPKTGSPILFDYQFKGMLKNAGQVLNKEVDGGVKNLKSKVNNQVFVRPRTLKLVHQDDIEYLERPARFETMQGPRVGLLRSEMLPEGTYFYAELHVMPGEISEAVLRELLNYGAYSGLGQWRNGGWGSFRYELEEITDEGD